MSPQEPSSQAPGHLASERRGSVAGYLVAAVLVAAIMGGIVVVFTVDGGGSAVPGPFGTHYEGLEQRRLAAGVPTMDDPDAGGPHIHAELAVYVRGEPVEVPANLGIPPDEPPGQMAGLHTHDRSGAIHVENAADPTLGQFFEIWGVAFSEKRLGPHRSGGDARVRMWVDGERSEALRKLVLADEQEIVVAYGARGEAPPGLDGPAGRAGGS